MSGILQGLIGSLKSAASSTTDAFFNLVTLLLNTTATNGAQNNTFLDSSTNNFTITRNGNTTQGTFTPFSQTGWGNYFGSSNYLTTPSSSAFNLSSGDWTIEGWFWLGSNSGDTRLFTVVNSSTDMYGAIVRSGTIRFGQLGVGEAPFGTINLNTWNHIAFSKTSTSTITCYINGTSTGTTTSYTLPNANCTVYIAASPANYALATTDGYISNFSIVKGTAVYSGSTITVPTTPLTAITNTSLLTCQSNRFIDNSTNAFAITTSGTPSVQAFSPFLPTTAYDTAVVGGSGYFDGSDYLNFTDTSNTLDMGGAVTSLEGFFYPTATTSAQCLVAKGGGAGSWSTSNGFEWQLTYSSSKFDFTFNNAGSPANVASATVPLNQWYHVAVATDASNNISLYLNGTRVTTSTNAITKPTSRTLMYLGQDVSGSYFTGYMSGVRFIGGSGAYNPTSTTITVPTAPPTAITNTKLLTNFTNAGIFDSAAKNDLETAGNLQVSTTQAKFGTTSMYFDGSGDYGLIRDTPLNTFGTSDFTIEAWVNTSQNSSEFVIIDFRDGNGLFPLIAHDSTNGVFYYLNSGYRIISSTVLNTGTWYHIAVSRSGSSTKMFINGTQVGSTYTDSSSLLCGAMRPALGINGVGLSSLAMTGYLDELRITRYARYTANFTPPTAAFPVQ